MTGAEHYMEAERMLATAPQCRSGHERDWYTAAAQVHATLSLAAATALGREGEGRTMASQDRAAWFDVAAECRKAATA